MIACQISVCRYLLLSLQVQPLPQKTAAVNKKLKSMKHGEHEKAIPRMKEVQKAQERALQEKSNLLT